MGQFEEGNKKGRGRPKGARNKKNVELENSVQEILENGVKNFEDAMAQLKPRDFVNTYVRLLEFRLPKYSRVENKSLNSQPVNIIFLPATKESAKVEGKKAIQIDQDTKLILPDEKDNS